MSLLSYQPVVHRGKARILVRFGSNKDYTERIRKVADARWSRTYQCWHIPDTIENRKKCGLPAPVPATIQTAIAKDSASKTITATLSANNRKEFRRFTEQLILKKYSKSTIKTYCNEILQLFKLLGNRPAQELSPEHLKRYLLYCTVKLKLSEHTLHSRLNALKFYFEQVLHRENFFWEIPRPKKPLQLPRLFNQDEIAAIIKAARNLKHKTMLMMAYAAGLRISEVINLKVEDIDSKRMSIFIRQAKGKKDRMVRLSPVLLVMLRAYWKEYSLGRAGYLFPGQNKAAPYSSRSLQLLLNAAKKKAGIVKPGSIHSLRHSFATHLLDKGTDVTMIQKLLGHNDIKTTLRYLHVSNRDMLQVMSPLDDLKLD